MRRATAALAAAGVLLAGCGADDDSTRTTNVAYYTFEAAGIGFTFRYPLALRPVEDPNDGKVLAAVTPTPDDVKNGLKVRRTSQQELVFESYSAEIRSQFEEQLGVKVDVRTERHAGIDMGVMEWSRDLTYEDLGQEQTTELRSTSYFFTASGKTWQLECLSATEHRDAIDTACELAIESIAPADG